MVNWLYPFHLKAGIWARVKAPLLSDRKRLSGYLCIGCFFFPFLIYAESLSYYQGYLLYQNEIKQAVPSIHFDELIEGMRAAHRGLVLSDEEIVRKRKELYNQAKEDRLADANRFMAEVILKPDRVELVKGKLAYQVIKQGEGIPVREEDSPLLLYKAKTLVNHQEIEIYEVSEPKKISLKSTIPGFLKGVIGMQAGEKRILYIHPDLAYGVGSVLIEPNSQMIFEVEVLDMQ